MTKNIAPTGQEAFFDKDEIIVSKTDLKGRITYCNPVFMRLAGYADKELIGAPHSIIRHPEMPRCIFKYLWDTLTAGREVFAYVNNLCKNGDHYWVLAHVTPSYDDQDHIVSYHSNRRVPDKKVVQEVIEPLYRTLIDEEKKHSNKKAGLEASYQMLVNILEEKGVSYDEFIFSLQA